MDFLKVEKELYIKFSSVNEILDDLIESTKKDEEATEKLKEVVVGVIETIKEILNTAANSNMEQTTKQEINVIDNNDTIIRKN